MLYYHATTDQVAYFKDKGVALGMIRSNAYRNFAHTSEFSFSPGDVMVLYTDGITEAKNSKGEEFGYDRLAAILGESKHLSAREIQDRIISSLYSFSESEALDDDYTTMVIKFN